MQHKTRKTTIWKSEGPAQAKPIKIAKFYLYLTADLEIASYESHLCYNDRVIEIFPSPSITLKKNSPQIASLKLEVSCMVRRAPLSVPFPNHV